MDATTKPAPREFLENVEEGDFLSAEDVAVLKQLQRMTGLARAINKASPSRKLERLRMTANSVTFEGLLADADEFGKDRGRGNDSQVRFGLKVFEGAFHGKVDLTPNKHGDGVDDAQFITERYMKAAAKATTFDAKAQPVRTQASKFRACVKGGGWTKGGAGEPLATANNLMNIWLKLRADPANAKQLDDAMNAFLKFNRTLIKRDQLPTDAELRSFCFKTDPHLATPEEILVGMRKTLVNLQDGKSSHGHAQLKNADTQAVLQALNVAVGNLVAARTTPAAKTKAA